MRAAAVAFAGPGRFSGSMLTAGLLVGTALLAGAGVGAVLRLVLPAGAMFLGGYFLLTDRRAALLELALWLFMVTPGIRRLVDYSAGWDVVNIIMLAPYCASMMCVLPALKGLFTQRFPYSFLFALLLACVVYALLLALIGGRVFAGVYDSLRWAVPPCVGLLVALDTGRREEYRDIVQRALTIGAVLMSAYAVYQYLFVPPWDAFWMNNVEMDSIGTPEPFLIRVFSTMNSPGSMATFLMCGVLMILPSRGLLRWPALGMAATAILLSIVRAVWLGTALGFIFVLFAGRGWRVRGSILAAILVLFVALSALTQVPEAAVMINARLESLTSLSGDTSATDRSNSYRDFFNYRLARDPFGRGLAISGTYSTYMDQGETMIIDGAVIEIGTAMGVIGGILYLAAVLALVAVCLRAGLRAEDGFTTGCAAAVFSATTLLTSGTITVGESGFIFWLAAGFCLSAAQTARLPGVRRAKAIAGR